MHFFIIISSHDFFGLFNQKRKLFISQKSPEGSRRQVKTWFAELLDTTMCFTDRVHRVLFNSVKTRSNVRCWITSGYLRNNDYPGAGVMTEQELMGSVYLLKGSVYQALDNHQFAAQCFKLALKVASNSCQQYCAILCRLNVYNLHLSSFVIDYYSYHLRSLDSEYLSFRR